MHTYVYAFIYTLVPKNIVAVCFVSNFFVLSCGGVYLKSVSKM